MCYPNVVVISKHEAIHDFYRDLLEGSCRLTSIRNPGDLFINDSEEDVNIIVLGNDVTSNSHFDLKSFTATWSSKAVIHFARDEPDYEQLTSIIVFSDLLRPHFCAFEEKRKWNGGALFSEESQPNLLYQIFNKIRAWLDFRPKSDRDLACNDHFYAAKEDEGHGARSLALESPGKAGSDSQQKEKYEVSVTSGSGGSVFVQPKHIQRSQVVLNGFLLGPFHIILNDLLINQWPSRKGKSLLAYLLYNHDRPVLRDMLMDKFWPNVSENSARNCLNVTLHGLRNQLKKATNSTDFIQYKKDCYLINPDLELNLDHEKFLDLIRKGRRLEKQEGLGSAIQSYEQATILYRGDFLENDIYDDWSSAERANIRESYLFTLDRLSNFYSACQKYDEAAALCKKILTKDNCREDVHRRLMKCYFFTGRRSQAVRQFEECEAILRKELEVSPARRTIELLEKIKRESLEAHPFSQRLLTDDVLTD